jgi:hypothetical protein
MGPAGSGADRQPTRRVQPVGRAQPGAGHLPARIKGNMNEVKGVTVKALADPATGCKM